MRPPIDSEPVLPYQPALDGLRAVAILLVLGYHSPLVGLQAGLLGVNIFFVLSGFLITALLLGERIRTGSISLARFYVRRALRIGPALLLMLAVVLVGGALVASGADGSLWQSTWAVITLRANWLNAARGLAPALGHTWSLSVEEQFYLGWPALLAVMLRLRAPRSALIGLTLLAACGCELTRARIWQATHSFSHALFLSRCAMGGILIGCATALALQAWRSRLADVHSRWLSWMGAAGGLGIVAVVAIGGRRITWLYQGGIGLLELAVAGVIVSVVLAPRSAVGRLLALGPLVSIGRISYSLYLWHVPVAVAIAGTQAGRVRWVQVCAELLIFALAALSYRFVERPILRFKRHFEPSSAGGSSVAS